MRITKSYSFTVTTIKQIEKWSALYGMTASSFVAMCIAEFIVRRKAENEESVEVPARLL